MINRSEILQTIAMIDQQHLDIRTITMGISLLDCADTDIDRSCTKVYDKICRLAGNLVRTGEDIEAEFGIPIVNKRVSVTPISLVAAGTGAQSFVPYARALDRAAHEIGVNFLGGFSALVHKGMTESDRVLIASIPEALAETELVCASVNVGSTRAGINMDAVAEMGRTVKRAAALTAAQGGMACAKLVVFANAVEDNPFMAGAFHGVGEPECEVHVGVSGPGVVQHALQSVHGQPFDVVAETVKKDGLPHHAHGPARGAGGVRAAGRAVRHRGPVARADARRRRQCGRRARGDGAGVRRRARHHGGACAAQRRGEKRAASWRRPTSAGYRARSSPCRRTPA